jgi:hypothetical protein
MKKEETISVDVAKDIYPILRSTLISKLNMMANNLKVLSKQVRIPSPKEARINCRKKLFGKYLPFLISITLK